MHERAKHLVQRVNTMTDTLLSHGIAFAWGAVFVLLLTT